jgi:hypothetical protein
MAASAEEQDRVEALSKECKQVSPTGYPEEDVTAPTGLKTVI